MLLGVSWGYVQFCTCPRESNFRRKRQFQPVTSAARFGIDQIVPELRAVLLPEKMINPFLRAHAKFLANFSCSYPLVLLLSSFSGLLIATVKQFNHMRRSGGQVESFPLPCDVFVPLIVLEAILL